MYMYNVQDYCVFYNNSVHSVDPIWVAPIWVDITLIDSIRVDIIWVDAMLIDTIRFEKYQFTPNINFR